LALTPLGPSGTSMDPHRIIRLVWRSCIKCPVYRRPGNRSSSAGHLGTWGCLAMRVPTQQPGKLPCMGICRPNELLDNGVRAVLLSWQDDWARAQDDKLWAISHQSWPSSPSLAPSGRRTPCLRNGHIRLT
jgi:hypothetical protein